MTGGLLAMSIRRAIDLPECLLIALLSAAAGHALAPLVENMLAECVTIPAWLDGDTRGFRLEVEPGRVSEVALVAGRTGIYRTANPRGRTGQGLET